MGGGAKDLLYCLIHALGLAVGLWMERRGWSKSDVEAITKVLPKTGGEAAVPVGDDGSWEAVVFHHVFKELVCSFLSGSLLKGGDEVA